MKRILQFLTAFYILTFGVQANAQYAVGYAYDLFDPISLVEMASVEAEFGLQLHYDEPLSGILALGKDKNGKTTVCDTVLEDYAGKIVLIDKGDCESFVKKCFYIARSGAAGILVAHNEPNKIGKMLIGNDPTDIQLAKLIGVPCIMITKEDGDEIKALFQTAGADPSIVCQFYHPNNYSQDAYPVKAGAYSKLRLISHDFAGNPEDVFPSKSAIDTINATESAFFLYNPTENGKISVESCNGNGDTNLHIYEADKAGLNLKKGGFTNRWDNEGACKKNAADTKNLAAALTDVPVKANKFYYIEFDDKNTPDSFTFRLSFKKDTVTIVPKPDLTCDAAALICDDFKNYNVGALTNGTAAHWSTWNNLPLPDVSPLYVTNEQFNSDTKAMKIDGKINPAQDVIFKTGNYSKGHYQLKWKMYIPSAANDKKRAYFNLQHDITGNHVWASEFYFDKNGLFSIELDNKLLGNGSWAANEWFDVSHDIDIDRDTTIVTIGNQKFGWKWSTSSPVNSANKKQLAGANFYADSTNTQYYIDDIQLVQLPSSKALVTFSVDMKYTTVDAAGVFVTGDFQSEIGQTNWTPNATPLTQKGNSTVYETTIELPLGNYQYKFVNGGKWDGKEEKNVGCESGGDNRKFAVNNFNDITVGTFCYNKCYSCDKKPVTFLVDMSKETNVTVVSIAGSFQSEAGQGNDWTPGVVLMDKVNNSNLFTKTLIIPEGTYEFKYVIGKTWGLDESVPNNAACAAGKDGNRKLIVGTAETIILDTVCYRHCVTCQKVVGNKDISSAMDVKLYPNPTNGLLYVENQDITNKITKIAVVNILGQIVQTIDLQNDFQTIIPIDVTALNVGTYYLNISNQQNQQRALRFVIEK